MKWKLPLSLEESSRLYWELSKRGAKSLGEKFSWQYGEINEEELAALAILQCRYDPRLLEILIDFFSRGLFHGNPIHLKKLLKANDALPITAVIAEFVLESSAPEEAKDLVRFLREGTRPVPVQLFYYSLHPIGGRKMDEAISRPPWAFKKWGFLSADAPLTRELAKRIYLFDLSSRQNILKNLALTKKRFRLRDYLLAVEGSISRQQALKDLDGASWISRRGKGKGSYYILS